MNTQKKNNLHDDILKAYYRATRKRRLRSKIRRRHNYVLQKEIRKHRLQHGNGFFDAFATPLIKFLSSKSLVKGVGSATISQKYKVIA
jgi:hypothetical protein